MPKAKSKSKKKQIAKSRKSDPESYDREAVSEPEFATSEPQSSEPEVSEPEVSEPEVSEPEVSEPNSSESESSESSHFPTSKFNMLTCITDAFVIAQGVRGVGRSKRVPALDKWQASLNVFKRAFAAPHVTNDRVLKALASDTFLDPRSFPAHTIYIGNAEQQKQDDARWVLTFCNPSQGGGLQPDMDPQCNQEICMDLHELYDHVQQHKGKTVPNMAYAFLKAQGEPTLGLNKSFSPDFCALVEMQHAMVKTNEDLTYERENGTIMTKFILPYVQQALASNPTWISTLGIFRMIPGSFIIESIVTKTASVLHWIAGNPLMTNAIMFISKMLRMSISLMVMMKSQGQWSDIMCTMEFIGRILDTVSYNPIWSLLCQVLIQTGRTLGSGLILKADGVVDGVIGLATGVVGNVFGLIRTIFASMLKDFFRLPSFTEMWTNFKSIFWNESKADAEILFVLSEVTDAVQGDFNYLMQIAGMAVFCFFLEQFPIDVLIAMIPGVGPIIAKVGDKRIRTVRQLVVLLFRGALEYDATLQAMKSTITELWQWISDILPCMGKILFELVVGTSWFEWIKQKLGFKFELPAFLKDGCKMDELSSVRQQGTTFIDLLKVWTAYQHAPKDEKAQAYTVMLSAFDKFKTQKKAKADKEANIAREKDIADDPSTLGSMRRGLADVGSAVKNTIGETWDGMRSFFGCDPRFKHVMRRNVLRVNGLWVHQYQKKSEYDQVYAPYKETRQMPKQFFGVSARDVQELYPDAVMNIKVPKQYGGRALVLIESNLPLKLIHTLNKLNINMCPDQSCLLASQ